MPLKVFFCYAHEDEPLLKILKTHLRPMQRQGLIDVWYDRDISAGTAWEQEISEQLNSAQIILLLISPDFMDSDYCYGTEMKRALERHKRGETIVIPIILRPVHWQDIVGDIQALPRDAKPIMGAGWHSLDDAFFNVAEGIKQTIGKLYTSSQLNSKMSKQTQDIHEQSADEAISQSSTDLTNIPKVKNKQREIRKRHQSGVFETSFELAYRGLSNPFQGLPEVGEMITSHVSGRSFDIQEIVMGGNNAIILNGSPRVGKTSLIRYLQRPPTAEWSWRNELEYLKTYFDLDQMYFTQIDLSGLEGIADADALLDPFIAQCIAALQSAWQHGSTEYSGLKGLRDLLRHMTRDYPESRYFMILDSIERLQGPNMPLLKEPTKAQTSQEHGLAVLDDCGAFRVLVDLLDEFSQFGVILSIESLPLPRIGDQFRHVSADLARFRTMTLQAFTQNDTLRLLEQEAESYGITWASQFRQTGGHELFTQDTQSWLYEQAGTHPYLLQQICFHTFNLQREYALRRGSWTDLQKIDREQLIERVNEWVSTFLDRTWKRVKIAVDECNQQTRNKFYNFIAESRDKQAFDEIEPEIWNQLGLELRYILCSEGIVRYDLLQPIYYPGSFLLLYFAQKVREQIGQM